MSNPPNINSFGNPPISTGQLTPAVLPYGQVPLNLPNNMPVNNPQPQNQSQSPFPPSQTKNSSPAFNLSGNKSYIPPGMLPPGQLPPKYVPSTSANNQNLQQPINFQPLNRVPPVSSPYTLNGPNSANTSQPSPVPLGNKPLVFNQSNNSSGAATPVVNQVYNGQPSHPPQSVNSVSQQPNGPPNTTAVSQQGSFMPINGASRSNIMPVTSQGAVPVVPPTNTLGRFIPNQMGPPSVSTSQMPPHAPVSHPQIPNQQFRMPTVNIGPPKTNTQSLGPPTSVNQVPIMNYSQPPMTINQTNAIPNKPPFLTNQSQPPLHQQSRPIGPPTGQQLYQKNAGLPLRPNIPPMPSSGIPGQPAVNPNNVQGRYPPAAPQYHGITQQMSNLSVTKQGYDQMWGHQVVDLMQCKNILPEYPEDPPEIRHVPQFAESNNCSPEIFRCTVNRIPETNSLLQKSRLPLGILIHPFKDLNHLPVIQCSNIVRCRACRTYINPFVYFVDSKRWKCNLCFRVNDLPEEFQYDPVSRSYGDPSRRPEIKSATIEYIAPSEYMLRPPQAAIYLFLLDVSSMARESGYLQVFCKTLLDSLDKIPGDGRTQMGFICFDSQIHFYMMNDTLTRPKEITVLDIDDVFLPSPESLLVNVSERKELLRELLTLLPNRYSSHGEPNSALGAALQAGYKLMAPTGGRVTVFQCCLPNIGPGALQSREDPNLRSSSEVSNLNPSTDFYKRIALECSGAQVAVDLFLLNSQYADLATLSGMSKFSAGSIHHVPLFKASRPHLVSRFSRMLSRYLTRKIGFEAVMRVRCTRGVSIHTFHGNFFVRSTDLLSLPVVSPDSAFGLQLAIDESLSDLQQICFQAALLYTSSKGERRIRVHTLSLPLASNLPEVLHSADQEAIIGLLVKMAVDRCASASMSEAKEALMTVAVDVVSATRLAQNINSDSATLLVPNTLKLLPMYLLAALKRKAFRTGTSTRLDDRVFDMCQMKSSPLDLILKAIVPELYAIHQIHMYEQQDNHLELPRLPLSANRIDANGVYLLDDGDCMSIYVGQMASNEFICQTFGSPNFNSLPDEIREIPQLDNPTNELVRNFIAKLNDDRPYDADLVVYKSTSPSRVSFTEKLIEDRFESAFSYYEFLQHVRSQIK